MAGKRRTPQQEEMRPAAEYYKLKTQAVDDLINANEENSPAVSADELEKFGGRKKGKLPEWVKIAFIKFWFPASVFFFIVMGLGLWNPLDQVLILGIVQGMVTDILTNPLLRMKAKPEGSNDRFMMFPRKRYMTFFFNMIYACALCFLTLCAYALADLGINWLAGTTGKQYLMGEPITFGLFYMLIDALLIVGKRFLARHWPGANSHNV